MAFLSGIVARGCSALSPLLPPPPSSSTLAGTSTPHPLCDAMQVESELWQVNGQQCRGHASQPLARIDLERECRHSIGGMLLNPSQFPPLMTQLNRSFDWLIYYFNASCDMVIPSSSGLVPLPQQLSCRCQ